VAVHGDRRSGAGQRGATNELSVREREAHPRMRPREGDQGRDVASDEGGLQIISSGQLRCLARRSALLLGDQIARGEQ